MRKITEHILAIIAVLVFLLLSDITATIIQERSFTPFFNFVVLAVAWILFFKLLALTNKRPRR